MVADRKEYIREWKRNKYRTDPEYRKKQIAYTVKKRALKYHSDPEYRRKLLDREKQRYLKKRGILLSRIKGRYPKDEVFRIARREYMKKWYKEQRAERKAERMRKSCEYQKYKTSSLRARILDVYGRECSCCGEKIEEFLTIDHIRGDGGSHRKSRGSMGILQDVIASGFCKESFRILCYNCNCGRARRKDGKCPHEVWSKSLLEKVG